MTACRSFLHARTLPGQRAALVQAFMTHRVLEQSRGAQPGCLAGELLLSSTDPGAVCVTMPRASQADHEAWLASPVRAVRGIALGAPVAEVLPPVPMSIAGALQSEPGRAP